MKNLFKNLMLVAVAAMAFTACTETNDEVNAVSKVTRYEFTANIADETRSGFAEKEEDATAYKSEWHDGDEIKIFVDGYDPIVKKISVDGKFEFDLTDAPETFYMTVCSPAESWTNEHGYIEYIIPTEQAPLANSVDPKAHVLQCQNVLVSNGKATDNIEMEHQVAYGKMTLNDVDFDIDYVELNIKGTAWGYSYEFDYTLAADEVAGDTFWFATQTLDVTEFTVTAYDADDNAVAKTVDMTGKEKPLAFSNGQVSTFSVSNLEAVVEPEALAFHEAYVSSAYGQDRYVYLSTTDSSLKVLRINFYNCFDTDENTLNAGNYSTPANNGIYDSYSTYGDTKIGSMKVTVSVVSNQYHLVITDVYDQSSVLLLEKATFTGIIEGLNVPDPRVKLEIPSNVQATVSGKTITLTWDPVEHAEGYQVKMWNPEDEAKIEVVTDPQYVFEAQKANTQYHFNVYSYASDENPTYRSSTNWYYLSVTTEDTDPKMELSVSKLSFTADAGEKTFTVTLKNTDAAIEYTQEGDWFSVVLSGDTFTVNASANESETDAREGSITVTAGTLSQTIDVTQSKKGAVETYSTVFTSCKCVSNMDMGEGWGAKFELSNDEGLFLWLWVIQTSVNQSTGAIATGVYNFHNEWCDYANPQPGFVVKKMKLPGHGDEEFNIIDASFSSNLNGTTNDLTFEITLEDNSTTTYTFNGTVERAF